MKEIKNVIDDTPMRERRLLESQHRLQQQRKNEEEEFVITGGHCDMLISVCPSSCLVYIYMFASL